MEVRSKLGIIALLAGIISVVVVLLLTYFNGEINWGKEDFTALFVLVTAGTFAALAVKNSCISKRTKILLTGIILLLVAALYIHLSVGLF